MREMLAGTGGAELPYWHAYLRLRDEREVERLERYGLAGL